MRVKIDSLVQKIYGEIMKEFLTAATSSTGGASLVGAATGQLYIAGATLHIGVAQRYVDKKVKVELPVTMRKLLYSFTFNVGTGAAGSSTMLKLIKSVKHKEACNQLWRWVYYYNPKTKKREVSRGIKNRRAEEYAYAVKEL
ncbi:endolysin [Shigella phage vB_SsoS_008]|nr:endolysin [Shigella phage vB_SsoS_008]